MVLQIDYSESYANIVQRKIQSVSFDQQFFSIFTVPCYLKKNEHILNKIFTVMSEASNHSRIDELSCWCITGVMLVQENSILDFLSISWQDLPWTGIKMGGTSRDGPTKW